LRPRYLLQIKTRAESLSWQSNLFYTC